MLKVAGFEKESFTDGLGVRYTIFTQGCRHNCPGCHNPETHDFKGGSLFKIERIVKDIKECDYLDGVTLSGGDPFFQSAAIAELVKQIREQTTLNIWCYTGFKFEDLLKNKNENIKYILNNIDVMVDGPFVHELKSLTLNFRGSSNQRVIDVRESLSRNNIVLFSKI